MRSYPFNAVQFFKDYRIHYWTEGKNVSPGWVNTQCMFCDDSSNHLGWNLSKGYVNCWKCGVHPLKEAISRLLKISQDRAFSIIKEYEEVSSTYLKQHKKIAQAESVQIPGSELSKYHRKYLESRNYDPDKLIEKYGITGTNPGEEWEKLNYELRIIVPIIFNRQVISFQGRDITDKQKERYKGCPIEKSVINYKHVFYNLDNANSDKVCVVEGIPDVWRMGDGFICSFGSTLHSSQIRILSEYFNTIYFLFDSEDEAQKKAKEYGNQLASMGKKVEVFDLHEDNLDPGDLPEYEVEEIRKELNL